MLRYIVWIISCKQTYVNIDLDILPSVTACLDKYLRFHMHFTPTSLRDCTWWNSGSDLLTNQFNLTPEEQRELLPSGKQAIRRGFFRITDRGLQVLKQKPVKIDVKFLEQFEEFKKFRAIRREKPTVMDEGEPETTPEEALANAYQNLKNDLASELLQQLKASSPRQFENIVIDLLVAMGYGGSRKEAAKAIGVVMKGLTGLLVKTD